MDEATVAVMVTICDSVELPPRLRALAGDEAWWRRLEATPEDALNQEQREMIEALGIIFPRET